MTSSIISILVHLKIHVGVVFILCHGLPISVLLELVKLSKSWRNVRGWSVSEDIVCAQAPQNTVALSCPVVWSGKSRDSVL